MSYELYLASSSARRKELLEQIGVNFLVIEPDIDETINKGETAIEFVNRMAQDKADKAYNLPCRELPIPIVAADTIVVFDGEILGKAKNLDTAKSTLTKLSGNKHKVYSSVCLKANNFCTTSISETSVWFDTLTSAEIDSYLASKEYIGKAGSYAIQGIAAKFIKRIEGSYSGVKGLPLYELNQLLSKLP